MTLFAAEMRKIWRPLPVLVLIAMGALWTFVGILPAFNDYTATEAYEPGTSLALTGEQRLIKRYGPLTDKATIDKMKADIPRLERQVTRDIQAHPTEAKTLGINDFADYERWNDSIVGRTSFYPTGAPNTLTDGKTSTGANTAESAAIAAAKRAKDPMAHMSEKQQRAIGEAEHIILRDSEALQDLYNISLLMRHFPMTQADAQHNLTNSVEMLRSTASTDHPITAVQKQFERDYWAEAENGWSTAISGGCATTDITGKTVTNETGGESDGDANDTTGNAGNDGSGTADADGMNDNGSSANGTGDAGDANASGSTSANNGDGTADDAQLGTGCNPDDASIGSQSYRVPGTMPKAVTERLARYAAEPGRSSYIQYSIVEKTWMYTFVIAVFSVIASAAMTMPVMVRDRGRRMMQLQWASRSGRSGQHARVAATAVTSLIIGLVSLAAFGIPLVVMLRDFLAVPVLTLNSNAGISGISFEYMFGVPIVPWAYWTFGQYLAIIGATVLVLTLAVTMLGAWLCRSMRSVIRMLLVMVPLLSLVLLPAQLIYFPNMFLMGNWFTNRLTVPGLEAWMPLGVLALAVAAWVFSTFRLGRRELVRN
ncbi:hypothetical protein [Bifidobacterium callitrichidarum]|uniref:Uncharacterized protein n=1 Tax=Bifidobacterium callitrichidarum TaxID=2052941 RepID=A0A2U2NAZ2_9BIFI|nr:hypothetical protein [Bifidobacterium callitrichidarum]PWG66169.1 hypothetical protein DF196_04990 [Bifidobacterium callitrichidarum]